jgi:acetyltransferase-like isoleucine patch superfamily enzyme
MIATIHHLLTTLHVQLWRLLGLTIGKNGRIGFGTYFTNPRQIKIGRNALISIRSAFDSNSTIAIGDNFQLNRNCWLAAHAPITIGNDVQIGPNCVITSYEHVFNNRHQTIFSQGKKGAPINIENDVWLGANVVVTAGVTIAQGSVIGAGSIVTKNTRPYSINAGVPCKLIKYRH